MGISQLSDQVRRAPTLALRAVFAGVGRILLSDDRLLARAGQSIARSSANGERPRLAAAGRQRPGLAPVAPPGSRWRPLDKTGNVRLLSDEDVDHDYGVPSEPRSSSGARRSPAEGVAERPERTHRPAASGRARVTEANAASRIQHRPPPGRRSPAPRRALPLANYDDLSVASIRARLRGLDVSQLRVLVEYESKNAERPEVLGMFERRISKLEAGE
jgi:hypothetical protein